MKIESDEDIAESDEGHVLRFGHGELWTIEAKLREAVQRALKNRKLSSRQIMELGAFLWLVEQLPTNHEEYCASLELSVDYGEGAGWRTVGIGEYGLEMRQGETIRSSYGSDHSSETVYKATTSRDSDFSLEFDLDEWLWHFARDCGGTDWEFSVSWYPEDTMPGHPG